jgi:hypothetical protein
LLIEGTQNKPENNQGNNKDNIKKSGQNSVNPVF